MLRNRASQEAREVKNPPANAGDARDAGSIPGLGRSSGGRNATPVFLACKIPCTEEPSRLQSLGSQRVGHNCASEHTGMRNRRIDTIDTHFSRQQWECAWHTVINSKCQVPGQPPPPHSFLFLATSPKHSHKPELRFPSDQDFPETLDFRHLQLDLLRSHGCLCHGDDVQLICAGDIKCRRQDPQGRVAFQEFSGTVPALLQRSSHPKRAHRSLPVFQVCICERDPLETRKHVSMGTVLQGRRRLRRGHPNLFKVITCSWQSLPGPSFWVSVPLTMAVHPVPVSKTSVFRQKMGVIITFSNTINNYLIGILSNISNSNMKWY